MSVPELVDSTSSLRRNAKAFLLTYAQTTLTRERVVEALQHPNVEYMVVAQEVHPETGGLHIHAYVLYKQARDTTLRTFDIGGEHPNIKTHRPGRKSQYDSHVACRAYVTKEDANPLVIGTFPANPEITRKRTRDDLMLEAREMCVAQSVEKALDFLHQQMPFETAKNEDTFERSLTKKRRGVLGAQVPARPISDFPAAPPIPEDWRALYIHGKTGSGKTQFARALLPEATVVSLRDQLRGVDFSKGIIFDDFDVYKWAGVSAIHLLDWDEPRGLDVKHGHVVIPPHTRKIVTFNEPLEKWVPEFATHNQVEAIRSRFTLVYGVPEGVKLFGPRPNYPMFAPSRQTSVVLEERFPPSSIVPPPEQEWGSSIPE